MDYPDYYAVLGVPKSATEKDIRSAYRKAARKYHPDVNRDDKAAEEKFKDINEAYEVLSDPEKRRKYDEVGSRWKEYERAQRAPSSAAAGGRSQPFDFGGYSGGQGGSYHYRTVNEDNLRDLFGDEEPFSDFFESLFGSAMGGQGARVRGNSRRPQRRPQSLEQPVQITLAQAYTGAELTLAMPDGRRIAVNIPPGVDTGSRVRVAGQAPGGGDLYLIIEVTPDPRFERRHDDLYTRVSAPLTTMLLGGETFVPTPDGRRLALTIPPLTQDGREFILRKQGMPRLSSPDRRGNLHAEVHTRLPERLSAEQKRLIQEFAGAGSEATAGAGSRR